MAKPFGSALNQPVHLHACVTDGVFAPNHPLRQAVTAVAIGNIGKPISTASDRRRTPGHDKAARPRDSERLRGHAGKPPLRRRVRRAGKGLLLTRETGARDP